MCSILWELIFPKVQNTFRYALANNDYFLLRFIPETTFVKNVTDYSPGFDTRFDQNFHSIYC